MKQLFFLCLALCAVPVLSAQPLTLTSANYSRLQPGDILTWHYFDDSEISIPERGPDRTWDYSPTSVVNFQVVSTEQPDNPVFPTADIKIPGFYNFAGYDLSVAQYYDFSDQGYYSLGDSYAGATLAGPSDGDTLFLPAQDNPLPRTELLFPATYGSSWSSAPVRYVINAEIKTAILPKTPARLVQNFMATADTVIGWGRLRLPGNINLNVLLKKQMVVRIDSFYLGSIPAPDFILNQLGLKQGETTREENYAFYTANLKGEAMHIRFVTRGTTSFTVAYYNSSAITSVREDSEQVESRLYPDPVAGSEAVLSFRKTNGRPWSVVVCDVLGREIFRRTVEQPQGEVQLPLHFGTTPAAGLYLYSIYNDAGTKTAGGTVRVQ